MAPINTIKQFNPFDPLQFVRIERREKKLPRLPRPVFAPKFDLFRFVQILVSPNEILSLSK